MSKALAKRSGTIQRNSEGFLRAALAGQLSPRTRQAYAADVTQFLNWLTGQQRNSQEWQQGTDGLAALRQLTRADVLAYQAHLAEAVETQRYRRLTANRKLATVRSLLKEAAAQGVLSASPATGVKGFKINGTFKATPALSKQEASALIHLPDRSLPGLRDRALLHLAIKTGMRATELASLRVEDLKEQQGHCVVRYVGKGGKECMTKVRPEVRRDLLAWFKASGRDDKPEAPMFAPLRKIGRGDEATWIVCEAPLSRVALWEIVKRRLREVIGDRADGYGPHSLRATFITQAMLGGAPAWAVQAAVGHSDMRTTMRYLRAQESLDDHPADYIHLNSDNGGG
jgi:site-specific recombinase XerD